MAYTAVTAWKKPRIVLQNSDIGTKAWLFETALAQGYAGSDVTKVPVFTTGGAPDLKVREARLVVNNTRGSVDKASDETVAANRTYGGSSDTWSQTLTGADLDSDFGYAVNYVETDGTATQSYYMYGLDFDFGLPAAAVITGIELRLSHTTYNAGGGLTGIQVSAIEMRVYWSWDVVVSAEGASVGLVYTENPHPPVKRKKFAHRVSSSAGDYLGQWQDVSEPKFKTAINTIHSNMALEFARNESTVSKAVEGLSTESDEAITTESDEAVVMDIATPTGLGAGTDLDLNHEVEIDVFYGDYVGLLTESDEPILTEDSEMFLVEDGAPAGRPLFTGYISRWLLEYGGKENITANLLTHSQELRNIMLETVDTVASSFTTDDGATYGIAGLGADDYLELGQTFQVASTTAVPKIRLKGAPWPAGTTVTMELRTGGTIGGGTLLGTSTVILDSGNDPGNMLFIDFLFDEQPSLSAATTYHFLLSTPDSKTGGNVIYPISFLANSAGGYASGSLFYNKKADPTFVDSSDDLWFEVYKAGGSTTVTFNSMDPALMYIRVIEFARSRGARVNYSTETIEPTGTVASFTFKTNTCDEALEQILKLCPADWYRWYDFGTNMAHLHPRPTTPSKYLIKGRNISSYKIGRNLEELENEAWFSGGGSPALFIKRSDTASRTEWRRGLKKLSDQRVTDSTTATLLSDSEIDRYNEPQYAGQAGYKGDDSTAIEDMELGELLGHQAFGSFVDALSLQVASIDYAPDLLTLELDTLLPKVNKRVEDIRRNLDTIEQENNPSSPS